MMKNHQLSTVIKNFETLPSPSWTKFNSIVLTGVGLGLSEKIAKIGNLFFVKTCGEQHKTVRNLFDSVRY